MTALLFILLQVLPFSAPRNLISTRDFSHAFWTKAAVTASSLGSFTTSGAGGVFPASTTTRVNYWYRLDIQISSTATFQIRHSSGDGTVIGTTAGIYKFKARTTGSVYIRLDGAGTASIYRLNLTRL